MSRARPTLIRRLAIELTKKMLSKTELSQHPRFRAALLALMKLHHGEVDTLLREKLGTLAEQVPDEDLGLLLSYCRHIELAWNALGTPSQGRLQQFLGRTDSVAALSDGDRVDALRDIVTSRIASMTETSLIAFAVATKRPDVLEAIVRRFEASRSLTEIRDLRAAFAEDALRSSWSLAHKKRLIAALATNNHVQRYWGYPGAVERILDLCRAAPDDLREDWRPLHVALLAVTANRGLADKVREVYPDFLPATSGDEAT
jgi:hypothetical protein